MKEAIKVWVQKTVCNIQYKRREYHRILYPAIGAVSPLPSVFYSGTELEIHNLSEGGMCIGDYEQVLKHCRQVDLEFRFTGSTGEKTLVQPVEIVDHARTRRHMKFIHTGNGLREHMQTALRAGFTGHLLKKQRQENPTVELWKGPTGEKIEFFLNDNTPVILSARVNLFWTSFNLFSSEAEAKPSGLTPEQRGQMIIALSNIHQPSEHIIRLVRHLEDEIVGNTLQIAMAANE